MKTLRVFGWTGWRPEEKGTKPNGQTREIMAAYSKAQVARIVGVKSPARLFNLCETGNQDEILVTAKKPFAIFWAPISRATIANYREAKPK